jgi:hypothetical protein
MRIVTYYEPARSSAHIASRTRPALATIQAGLGTKADSSMITIPATSCGMRVCFLP